MSSQMATNPLSVAHDAVLPLVGRMLLSAIFLISGVGKVAAPAATAAVWLCSDEASYVFGQMLVVDGGMTIGGFAMEV